MFTKSEIAKKANVNVETIRYYDKLKLIQPIKRLENGYKVYDEQTILKIKFIKHAQELGFTLKESKDLLSIGSNNMCCEDVEDSAVNKIYEIDKKIKSLLNMKEALEQLIHKCELNPLKSSCPLIDELYKNEEI